MKEEEQAMARGGHVVVIPYPSQGHVNPLMHFSQALAKQGIKITFLNTDFVNNRLVRAMGDNMAAILGSQIQLLSVPDGFPPDVTRDNIERLFVHIMNNLHSEFKQLLSKMNEQTHNPISCVIADLSMAWVLEIAHELGIEGATFSVLAAAQSVMNVSIDRMVEDGIIDSEGVPLKEKIQLSPGMPFMRTEDFPWRRIPLKKSQKLIFEHLLRIRRGYGLAKWSIVNTASELEPESVAMDPRILSVGPLMATEAGQFWKEDTSCLDWLYQQPPSSVVYLAFGSTGDFSRTQFAELAMGFELTGRPYLWVVRPGSEHELPEEFSGARAKIIKWAPQQKVLSHPSVGCFMSHCGWNSTMEALNNGLPILCWPYVGEQNFNQSYIVDIWKIGVGFERDEKGVASRWEIKKKVEKVMGDEGFRARSAALKEKMRRATEAGGSSCANLEKVVRWVKK